MNLRLLSTRSAIVAASLTLLSSLLATPLMAKAGGTPAGTAIVNQATSSYSDTNGNAYTSTSNRVTTTVQSAPSVSVTDTTVQSTTPGGQLTDVFTLTNTGNGNANFVLPASATAEAGTDGTYASVPNSGYIVTFPTAIATPAATGCTVVTSTVESCTYAGAIALLGSTQNYIAEGGVVTIGTVVNVSTSATGGTLSGTNQTAITTLSAQSTQSTANNAGAASTVTSAAGATGSSASETDNVLADARIDLQKFGVQPSTAANGTTGAPANTSTTNIEYVIDAADGGSLPARDLQSVKTLLGGSAPAGIFISDKVPSYTPTGTSTAVLAPIVSAAVSTSTANGFGATSTYGIYYTTSTNGSTGWTLYSGSGAFPANVAYIGVLVSGTATAELGTNVNTTSTGNVSTAKAAVTLTFYVTPPSGSGSGNANAYLNAADGVIGGNQPNLNPDPYAGTTNPAQNVIGPGIPANTTDATTAIDSGTQGILYPTGTAPQNAPTADTSNTVGNMAVVAALVLNGPYSLPGAIGSYNGSTPSNNNDNTAVGFTPSGFIPTNGSTATATVPAGNALGATATVNIPNTFQNVGNTADVITVNVTAPTGFVAQIYSYSQYNPTTGAVSGTPLASSTTNTVSYSFPSTPSGQTTDTTNQASYVVSYTVPATATAFTPYDAVVTATGANAPVSSNVTHNDLIPGGPIALFKTVTLDTASTCPGNNAVPGCIMTYAITYLNNANPASACPGTAPAASSIPSYLAGYYAKGLTINENGSTAPNTWGNSYTYNGNTYKNTTGLNGPATDTNSASTFTNNTAGTYAFSDLVGGSTSYVLAPGCSGTLTFRVTVSTQ